MKHGDMYCYAIVSIESHGFMIKTGANLIYCLDEQDDGSFWLRGTNEVYVKPELENVLIQDRRNPKIDPLSNYLCVYKEGMTEEEVVAMIKPQLEQVLEMRAKVWELLAKNAREMLAACKEGKAEHLCPPGWGEEPA